MPVCVCVCVCFRQYLLMYIYFIKQEVKTAFYLINFEGICFPLFFSDKSCLELIR